MSKEKIEYMRIALALMGIGIHEKDLYKVVRVYEAVNGDKGGDLNLKDVVKIGCDADKIYDTKFEFKPKDKR